MKKYTKAIFSAATAALISLSLSVSAFAQTANVNGTNAAQVQATADEKVAEDKEKTTYIFWDSNKGNDKSDGSTADKAVKSLENVLSIINKDNFEKTKKSTNAGETAEKVKDEESVKFVVVKCTSGDLTEKESTFIEKNKISVITLSEYEIVLKAENEAKQSEPEENTDSSDQKEENSDNNKDIDNDKDIKEEKKEGIQETDEEDVAADDNTKADEKNETITNTDTSDKNAAAENSNADKNLESEQINENVENDKTDATGEGVKTENNSNANIVSLKKSNKMLAVPNMVALIENTDSENETAAANSDDEVQVMSLTEGNAAMTAEVVDDEEETATADNDAISLLALPGNDLVGGGTKPVKSTETQNQSGATASTNTNESTKSQTSNTTGGKISSQTASATENQNLKLAGGKSTSDKPGSVNTGDETNIIPIAVICVLAIAGAVIILLKRMTKK